MYWFCEVLNAGKNPLSQLFFAEGEQPKVTRSQVGIVVGVGQNLDVGMGQEPRCVAAFTKVSVTLALSALLSFGVHFDSGTVDDATFFNHVTFLNHVQQPHGC